MNKPFSTYRLSNILHYPISDQIRAVVQVDTFRTVKGVAWAKFLFSKNTDCKTHVGPSLRNPSKIHEEICTCIINSFFFFFLRLHAHSLKPVARLEASFFLLFFGFFFL